MEFCDSRPTGVKPAIGCSIHVVHCRILTPLSTTSQEVLTPPRAKAASSDEPSPRQKVLQQCGQDEPLSFSQIIPVRLVTFDLYR